MSFEYDEPSPKEWHIPRDLAAVAGGAQEEDGPPPQELVPPHP